MCYVMIMFMCMFIHMFVLCVYVYDICVIFMLMFMHVFMFSVASELQQCVVEFLLFTLGAATLLRGLCHQQSELAPLAPMRRTRTAVMS